MERERLSTPQQDTGMDWPWDMDRKTQNYQQELIRVRGSQYEADLPDSETEDENTHRELIMDALPPEEKTPKQKKKKKRHLHRDVNSNRDIPEMPENIPPAHGPPRAFDPAVIPMETLLRMQNMEEKERPVQETGLNCGCRPWRMGRAWRDDLPDLAFDSDAESPETPDTLDELEIYRNGEQFW